MLISHEAFENILLTPTKFLMLSVFVYDEYTHIDTIFCNKKLLLIL